MVKSLRIGQSAGDCLSALLVAYGSVSETGKVWVEGRRPTCNALLKVQSDPFRKAGGCRFEAGSKASSLNERREITVHPSGASTYSPSGGKKYKIYDQ